MGDMLPSTYLVDHKLAQLDAAQASDSLLFQNYLSSDSVSVQELIVSEDGAMDMMLFIPPNNVSSGLFCKGSLEADCSESIPQHHELSLSLGSQEQSFVNLNHDSNSGLCAFLGSDMQLGVHHHSQNVHYLPFRSANTSVNCLEARFMPVLNEGVAYTDMFCNSKFIKTTQDLLVELVNVNRDSKPRRKEPNRERTPVSTHSNHNDLHNKLEKLSSMLDEVEMRYKLYRHQLRLLVSSFEIVAGRGASFVYTKLARKTISRQFRSLHDAIKKQIEASERGLGKQEGSSGALSRMRNLDEQLRHRKVIQHFGFMKRPQRGLPETAISVLRAWLFDHFLHPYPTESEKRILATRAGLTRSQVANWFINARVRLWKPMIEDIYKEEFGEGGDESKFPLDDTTKNEEIRCIREREDAFETANVIEDSGKRVRKTSVSLDIGLQNNKNSSMTT